MNTRIEVCCCNLLLLQQLLCAICQFSSEIIFQQETAWGAQDN